jgi:hypothetical protein
MKNARLNILAYFLTLIFISPVVTQGLHDAFFHDYSHDFHHSNNISLDNISHNVCFIHGFKYNTFDLNHVTDSRFLKPDKSFQYLPFIKYFFNNNSHKYFLLRAPPVLV